MTKGGYIAANAIGGLIAGGVGAAVANASGNYPVVKGALATSALTTLLSAAIIAGADSSKLAAAGVSGSLSGSLHNPRFP